MGTKMITVPFVSSVAAKVKKWKIREGMVVSQGRIIFLYETTAGSTKEVFKFKCQQVGTVKRLLVKEGDVVSPGAQLLELEECNHPTVMKDMCAECGADLRKDENASVNASVPMVHSIPELKVSEEQAQIIGKADEERLLKDKKLVLLVDLDQTLIHTTNDNIPPNLKDVYHFQLYGPMSPWYHTRIRPGTQKFLEEISTKYELHICTFGARHYAHTIAMFLDPDGKYFSQRILSRDECFDANSKTANLKALFPCGDNLVCIIDDREDVWNYAPNLIHVKPYHFFQHTGDINAPPGLSKKENDEIAGFDFSNLDAETKKKKEETEKMEVLGETTTDKDTDDEQEQPTKEKDSEFTDIQKVTGDLELSEDDSEDFKPPAANFDDKTKLNDESSDKNPQVALTPAGCKGATVVQMDISNENEIVLENNFNSNLSISNKAEPDKKDSKNSKLKKKEEDNENSENVNETESDTNRPTEGISKAVTDANTTVCNTSIDIKKADGNKPLGEAVVNKDQTNADKSMGETGVKDNDKNDEPDTNKTVSGAGVANDKIEPNESKPAGGTVEDTTVCEDITGGDKAVNEIVEQKKDEGDDLIEVEDTDDYLLYLVDILNNIHKSFYTVYEKLEQKTEIPDLKKIIPNVKGEVLKGCHLVFSGIVPSHVPLEQSRAYSVAVSLGAVVTQDLTPSTTHLVAARPGTAKVNSSRRQKGVVVVTPLWLWNCAERWERLDERLYPLGRSSIANRHPPAHCGSPEHISGGTTPTHESTAVYTPMLRNRTPSGRFIDTINPLLTFSSEDIQSMDKEVEDMFNDDDDDSEEEPKRTIVQTIPKEDSSSSSSSEDSLSGSSHPHGWKEPNFKSRKRAAETTTCTESDIDDESPSVKFRRGEPLPSDIELGESQESDRSDDPPDDIDDGDWNMMGAALEREFLSGN